MMAELGSHQLDAASIFVSALYDEGAEHPHPLRVVAAANRPIFPPDRDIEDHVCCIIEFPMPGYKEEDPKTHRKKIEVQYASVNGNGFLGYGELVYGTKGTIALKQEQELKLITGSEDESESETVVKVSGGGGSGPTLDTQSSGPAHGGEAAVSRGYKEEIEHWAWCIRHHDKAEPAPLYAQGGDGRRHHRLDDEPCRADRPANPLPQGVVRSDQGRHAGKRLEDHLRKTHVSMCWRQSDRRKEFP